jgi:hypothetical protein
MGAIIKSGNAAHDAALLAAEATRTAALQASGLTQAQAKAADIAYARAALASCAANNSGVGVAFFQEMLVELGTGGR